MTGFRETRGRLPAIGPDAMHCHRVHPKPAAPGCEIVPRAGPISVRVP